MRLPASLLLGIAALVLSGCALSWSSQQPPQTFTTGFWIWDSSFVEEDSYSAPLDELYVHVGYIHSAEQWLATGNLPSRLPPAKEYWLVFRYERQAVPSLQATAPVAESVTNLLAAARRRGLNVAGVQLDIDSPTGELPKYAAFLHDLRQQLPRGCEISITALLDWFRSGTAAADVIKEVDEFVPQFYDVDRADSRVAIAAKIDAGRWGPVFNRFGKRFRLGVSTFGRARLAPKESSSAKRYGRVVMFGDVRPLDFATNPHFQLETARNPADELVLTYRAKQKTRVSYTDFQAGDAVQLIVATPESVRAAVQSARLIGGHLAGVVFFRWQSYDDPLSMQPDEVLAAAGVAGGPPAEARIAAIDGACVAVQCVDLYLVGPGAFSPQPARYRIRASAELEYFLPEPGLPVRMTGPAELDLALPAYCARGRLYLGRAVSIRHAEYSVEEQP